MLNVSLLVLGFIGMAAPGANPPVEPGSAFCFGVGCPCGNDDPTGGCRTSSGRGAVLTATGSASIAADDIELTASHLPPHAFSLLVLSQSQRGVHLGDGRMCVGPGLFRFHTRAKSGYAGSVHFADVIATCAAWGCAIQPGETWNAQVWFREPSDTAMCSDLRVNMTNAYTVTFTP